MALRFVAPKSHPERRDRGAPSSGRRDPSTLAAASSSTTRRIFQAAAVISAGTLAIRLAGLVKSQVVAASFGVGEAVEAYFLAGVLPIFAFGALGSTLPSALVPVVIRLRAGDTQGRADTLLRDLYAWSSVILLAASALLAAIWPLFLSVAGSDFDAPKRALANELFFLLLPIVFLHGAATVWGAVLKAEKRFLAPTLAPGAVPITITLVVLALAREHGVHALVAGHVLGVALELVWIGSALARSRTPALPSWRPRVTPETRSLFGQYLPALGGGLLFASSLLVDQSMAARLPQGSLATLSYANTLTTALLSIGTTALGTAILPFLSDMSARGDHAHMRASLRASTRAVFLVALPACLFLAAAATPLVSLIFERGAFGAGESAAVGGVFALYVLQIPFYTSEVLCSRVLSALQQNHVVLVAALANLLLNIVLNLLFMSWMGVRGIALATSVTHLLVALALWIVVERRLASGARPAQ